MTEASPQCQRGLVVTLRHALHLGSGNEQDYRLQIDKAADEPVNRPGFTGEFVVQ